MAKKINTADFLRSLHEEGFLDKLNKAVSKVPISIEEKRRGAVFFGTEFPDGESYLTSVGTISRQKIRKYSHYAMNIKAEGLYLMAHTDRQLITTFDVNQANYRLEFEKELVDVPGGGVMMNGKVFTCSGYNQNVDHSLIYILHDIYDLVLRHGDTINEAIKRFDGDVESVLHNDRGLDYSDPREMLKRDVSPGFFILPIFFEHNRRTDRRERRRFRWISAREMWRFSRNRASRERRSI